MPFKYESMQERLIMNSIVSETHGYAGSRCWVWVGTYVVSRGGQRYGRVSMRVTRGPRKGKVITHLAHRVSLHAFKGVTLGHRKMGMHLCNNTLCVNPDHLSGGTQKQNVRQAVKQGRHKPGVANQHGRFK